MCTCVYKHLICETVSDTEHEWLFHLQAPHTHTQFSTIRVKGGTRGWLCVHLLQLWQRECIKRKKQRICAVFSHKHTESCWGPSLYPFHRSPIHKSLALQGKKRSEDMCEPGARRPNIGQVDLRKARKSFTICKQWLCSEWKTSMLFVAYYQSPFQEKSVHQAANFATPPGSYVSHPRPGPLYLNGEILKS